MNSPSKAQKSLQFSIIDLKVFLFVGALFGLLMRGYGIATILPWALLYCTCHALFVIGMWLVIGVQEARQNDPSSPRKLAIFDNSYEADLMVSRLAEYDISATAVGGFVSGFQAESPGYVDVVVQAADYVKAEDLIASWNNQPIENRTGIEGND